MEMRLDRANVVRFWQERSSGKDTSLTWARSCSPALIVLRGMALFAALLFHSSHSHLSAQYQPSECQVKAAFLFHFAQLVEWPSSAVGPETQPLIICTVDNDSDSEALAAALQGKQITSHPIQIRRIHRREDARGCHVLSFIGKDSKRTAAFLDALENAPVLTVGDSDGFAANGGMIGLFVQDNKIRFDINLNAAQRANLKISSRLLLLARTVIGDARTG
jgi:hypothetical protein